MIPVNTHTFTLTDDSKVEATLNFGRLKMLSAKHKTIYKEYNRVSSSTKMTEIDMIYILYTAYACANLDEELMDFDDFLCLMPEDRYVVQEYFTAVYGKPKN